MAEPIYSPGQGRYGTELIHRATHSTATGEIQKDMQERTWGTTKLLTGLRGMCFVMKHTIPYLKQPCRISVDSVYMSLSLPKNGWFGCMVLG